MPPSNGGTTNPIGLALYPIAAVSGVSFYFFDVSSFDDQNSGSFYSYKVEDVIAGRTPTCSRIVLSYTDLGPCSVTLSLTGTNDAGKIVQTTQVVNLGTVAASGLILTKLVGMNLSAQNLQLTIFRDPAGGQVSIVKVRLEGKVETTPYAG